MIKRILNPLKSKSFFLFGPRGSGKSTYLKSLFNDSKEHFFLDLLDPFLRDELITDPDRFRNLVLNNINKTIVIDEIQKIPKLLDLVHQLIESHKAKFILTGSSARRFKQQGTNLLAGRALLYYLYPFTSFELGSKFDLGRALHFGTLPDAYLAKEDVESQEYLRAYNINYLEKEIQLEQWVRRLDPFRAFLQIAAQMNGKIINRSKIAREVGVDDMTIESYFEILNDTLMGTMIPAFDRSIRRSQKKAPKFYFFDPGIKRAAERTLNVALVPKTSAYGAAFEHWIFLELYKGASYHRLDWQFSYLRTKEDVEIDFIIRRPGKSLLLLEVKSKNKISKEDVKPLETLGVDLEKKLKTKCVRVLLSQDPLVQTFGTTKAYPWQLGVSKLLDESI